MVLLWREPQFSPSRSISARRLHCARKTAHSMSRCDNGISAAMRLDDGSSGTVRLAAPGSPAAASPQTS